MTIWRTLNKNHSPGVHVTGFLTHRLLLLGALCWSFPSWLLNFRMPQGSLYLGLLFSLSEVILFKPLSNSRWTSKWSTCLCISSTWLSHKHLKMNTSKTELECLAPPFKIKKSFLLFSPAPKHYINLLLFFTTVYIKSIHWSLICWVFHWYRCWDLASPPLPTSLKPPSALTWLAATGLLPQQPPGSTLGVLKSVVHPRGSQNDTVNQSSAQS